MGRGFEDLEVYQAPRAFRVRVCRLARQLPEDERFNLCSQMRRAALSVTNCIAEGHGSRGFKHNISYLYRARGSVCELIDDLNACSDESYFKVEHLNDLRSDADRLLQLVNGYIRHLRRRMEDCTD